MEATGELALGLMGMEALAWPRDGCEIKRSRFVAGSE